VRLAPPETQVWEAQSTREGSVAEVESRDKSSVEVETEERDTAADKPADRVTPGRKSSVEVETEDRVTNGVEAGLTVEREVEAGGEAVLLSDGFDREEDFEAS